MLTNSDEELQSVWWCVGYVGPLTHHDREGDKDRLLREMRFVASPVFVESCHDSVTLVRHQYVEPFLLRTDPVLALGLSLLVLAQSATDIKVAIPQAPRLYQGGPSL